MPEVYCQFLKRKVDGGYCAFMCGLTETEKRIVYNPLRGIQTSCRFSTLLSEIKPINEKEFSRVKGRL